MALAIMIATRDPAQMLMLQELLNLNMINEALVLPRPPISIPLISVVPQAIRDQLVGLPKNEGPSARQ